MTVLPTGLYEEAIKELVLEGHANPGFDPYNKYEGVQTFYMGSLASFILYRVLESHIMIELIYVSKKRRGSGAGKKILSEFVALVRSKASWPKAIRAEIIEGNQGSFSLFKEFRTRQVEKEITV
jgi:GNAT superfamily N-acetyltransferase